MKIKIWMSVLCAAACLCMSGCGGSRNNPRTAESNQEAAMEPSISTSTDVAVIERLFPSLEGAETIEMEQLKYGGSERPEVLPGPVDYQYRGYITLSETAAEKYAAAYSFSEMQAQVPFELIKEREGRWTYSFDFSKDIIPAGYSGYIWMDGSTLLFDIGTM